MNLNQDHLKEWVEQHDYRLVLINGDYADCPSCNDYALLDIDTFWDEKGLLEHVCKYTNISRMDTIYLMCMDTGELVKYCDIDTKVGFHNVASLEFELPEKGRVLIIQGDSGWKVADESETILYADHK